MKKGSMLQAPKSSMTIFVISSGICRFKKEKI